MNFRVNRNAQIWIGVAIALVVLLLIWVSNADAQAAVPDTTVDFAPFLADLRPYIVQVIGALMSLLVLWIGYLGQRFLGIKITDKFRDRLHEAATNGAMLVVDKLDDRLDDRQLEVKSAAMRKGVEYVLNKVPDTVKYFGMTPEAVGEILETKVVALQKFPPAPTPTVGSVSVVVDPATAAAISPAAAAAVAAGKPGLY